MIDVCRLFSAALENVLGQSEQRVEQLRVPLGGAPLEGTAAGSGDTVGTRHDRGGALVVSIHFQLGEDPVGEGAKNLNERITYVVN